MMTVWATYRNSDMTEGRGPMVLDKVFAHRLDAEKYVWDQSGVMGRHPRQFGSASWEGMGDWQVRQIQVFDNLREAEQHTDEELRASALRKLTDAERKALGVGL